MPLESADYIAGLNVSNPLGSDERSTVDDHLRLIKTCVKNSIPVDLKNVSNPVPGQSLRYNPSFGGGFGNVGRYATRLKRTTTITLVAGIEQDIVWEVEQEDDFGIFGGIASANLVVPANCPEFSIWMGMEGAAPGVNSELRIRAYNATSSLRFPGNSTYESTAVISTTPVTAVVSGWYPLALCRQGYRDVDLLAPNANDIIKVGLTSSVNVNVFSCALLLLPLE
jgi:hypothetical protein